MSGLQGTIVDDLLTQARRRILVARLLGDAFFALAGFLGALTLLLILGTQIFNWWIPVVVGAAALIATFSVTWSRAPSQPTAARILDQRCRLADALSTELHFRNSDLALVPAQRERAEELARTIDLQHTLPVRRPKALYPAAGLLAVALFLLFLRFATEQRLSLTSPILSIYQDPLALSAKAAEKTKQAEKAKMKPSGDELVSRLGDSTADNPAAQDLAPPPGQQAISSGIPNPEAVGDGKAPGNKKDASGDSEASSGAEVGANAPKEGGDQPPSSRDGSPQGGQGAGGKSPSPSENAGLLGKLKDAVTSLMAKMKPQNQPSQTGQQGQQQAGNKPQGAGQQSGQQQKGPQNGSSQQQQDGEESAASDADQTAPGKGAGKSNDQNAAAKPGSGMGRSDGAKEIHDAEQLAALGKLSEIIGKRSANITGEMTIESQSGPQQLKTGYTRTRAKHGESSGDVSRDEVPIALQSYVQSYFEQVRKQAAVKARNGRAEAQP